MGFVGGAKIAGLGLFLAYIVGSVVGLYVLAVLRKRNMAIAFGPFLAIGLYASLFFYDPIVKTVLNFGGR
ncbi:MAG: Prepilin peptidase [Patescibacteria group bacterium]|nr:Prepilin peptidase [Patescibacteria group bacterium]